jgi:hypothetical protein
MEGVDPMSQPEPMSPAFSEPARVVPAPASQGWGLAALVLGVTLLVASVLTHILCWLYVSLAQQYMSDIDTRLGLAMCVLDVALVIFLGVLAIVAGALGIREGRRLGRNRGVAFVGLLTASIGLLAWLFAATNLMIVAISRLR